MSSSCMTFEIFSFVRIYVVVLYVVILCILIDSYESWSKKLSVASPKRW